jgi:magnesium-transporting ATPase (P-type)
MPSRGLPFTFTVKHKLEFSSARKRMSMIIACPDGIHRLFSKGADDKIESFCLSNSSFEAARTHLKEFSAAGLRTLALCYRELSTAEVDAFAAKEQEAMRQLMDKSEIDLLWQSVEHDCVCLGCTAIEDKLQEGVPETIQALRRASIKVWMLTGDKRETAHDIAKTTFLIDKDTTKYQFFPDDGDDCSLRGMQLLFHSKIQAALADIESKRANKQQQQQQYSVFIGSEFVTRLINQQHTCHLTTFPPTLAI